MTLKSEGKGKQFFHICLWYEDLIRVVAEDLLFLIWVTVCQVHARECRCLWGPEETFKTLELESQVNR